MQPGGNTHAVLVHDQGDQVGVPGRPAEPGEVGSAQLQDELLYPVAAPAADVATRAGGLL